MRQVCSGVKTVLMGFCTGSLFLQDRQKISNFTWMCWNDWVTACNENVQKSGRVGIGSCTMTMPWRTQPWASSPPQYSPDHAPGDFIYSHGWIRIWKGSVLLKLQRFSENHWPPLTAFPLKILDIVSSSGSSAGVAASSHRGSTLKGTKVSDLYEYFK